MLPLVVVACLRICVVGLHGFAYVTGLPRYNDTVGLPTAYLPRYSYDSERVGYVVPVVIVLMDALPRRYLTVASLDYRPSPCITALCLQPDVPC